MENKKKLEKEKNELLAEHLYDWLSKQKYCDEEILHAAVCCDFVGMVRFKKAIASQINIFYNLEQPTKLK